MQFDSSGSHSDMEPLTIVEREIEIDEMVEILGFGWFQIRLLILLGINHFFFALEMMLISYVGMAISCDWKITSAQIASLTTAIFIGIFFGSVTWGSLSDNYGRKKALMLAVLMLFISGVASSYSSNFNVLFVTRVFVGFAIGGGHNCVTLLTEYVPKAKRGLCLIIYDVCFASGTFGILVLAWIILPNFGPESWRTFLFVVGVPLGPVFLMHYYLTPESARFLLLHNKHQEAMEEIRRVSFLNRKEIPIGVTLSKIPVDFSDGGGAGSSGLSVLFRGGMYKTTLLLWGIWIGTVFFYYGTVLFSVELANLMDKGRCDPLGVMDSSASVGDPTDGAQACSLTNAGYLQNAIATSAEFPASFTTAIVVDRFGRKSLLTYCYTVAGIFVILCNFCYSSYVQYLVEYLARAHISGAFQILYLYTSEVYPTISRALGLGIASSLGRIGGAVTPFVAITVFGMPDGGPGIALGVYACASIMMAIFAWLLPKETLGSKLDDSRNAGNSSVQ